MFYNHFLVLLLNINILTNYYIWTQPKCQSYDKTNTYLAYNLVFTLQAILVTFENLDIVIKESKESKPDGGNDHQDKICITDTSEE